MTTRKTKPKDTTPQFTVPTTVEEAEVLVNECLTYLLAKEWTPEKIEIRINAILVKRLEEAVAKHLGFDNGWGRWELNRSNQYEKTSPIGIAMNDLIAKTVQRLFTEAEAAGKFELDKSLINSMDKYFKEQVTGYKGREITERIAAQKLKRFEELISGKLLTKGITDEADF